jgi:hypothetical protein
VAKIISPDEIVSLDGGPRCPHCLSTDRVVVRRAPDPTDPNRFSGEATCEQCDRDLSFRYTQRSDGRDGPPDDETTDQGEDDERAASAQADDDQDDDGDTQRFLDTPGLAPRCPRCESPAVNVTQWPDPPEDDPERKSSGAGTCQACGAPFVFSYLPAQNRATAATG